MSKFLVVIIFLSVRLFGCGPGVYIPALYKDGYVDFLPKVKDTLYSYAYVGCYKYDLVKAHYQEKRDKLNIKEWSEYLKIPQDEAKRIVYGNKSPIMIEKEKQPSFLAYKKALKNIKDYDTNWTKVEEVFLPLYKSEKLPFFKLRIAYNLIKAYHNQKKFDKELELINSLNKYDFPPSIVWEWIDSFKAGAIKNKGDLVISSYLFAKVFATHVSDAYIGYYDFEIKSDKEWSELLAKAKNDEEKTLFYFLRALSPKANKLLELKEMTNIDPNSKWVRRLSLMLAQKVQYLSYEKTFEDEEKFAKEDIGFIKGYISYLKEHQTNDENRFLYNYLNLIAFNQKHLYHDRLLDYIYYIQNLKKLDEKEVSKKLLEIEKYYDKSSVDRLTLEIISKLYPYNSLKGYLADSYEDEYRGYFYSEDIIQVMDKSDLDQFINLSFKKEPTYIEKLLKGMISVKSISKNKIDFYYSLIYTGKEEFEKAYELMQKSGFERKEYENPFNVKFAGDNRTPWQKPRKIYTQSKFLKTMIEIDKKLKQNPNSVMDNFLKATALYNITCFGNTPVFKYIFRSTIRNYHDDKLLDSSKRYYLKALKLTNDKELKAKIIYALMKIEFSKKQQDVDNLSDGYFPTLYDNPKTLKKFVLSNKEYIKLYKKLQEYKDTKYYQEIKNCATFKFFK